MPRLTGILETALYVTNVERSRAFYERLFETKPLDVESDFCALDIAGRQVLLLFRKGTKREAHEVAGGTIPGHDGDGTLHVAFAIPAAELSAWESRMAAQDIPIEGRVRWQRGGTSIYFRDPDGNLVEFATPGIWAVY
jgi:catechol 2,3-dioxygenase-like lactoylglutathione lyase family enzyme